MSLNETTGVKCFYGTIPKQDTAPSKDEWTYGGFNSVHFYICLTATISAIFSLVTLGFAVDPYVQSDKDKKDHWSIIVPATTAILSLIATITTIVRACFCKADKS